VNATPITGEPVTPQEVADLERLRGYFSPDTSLANTTKFAEWLFATVAVVGTVGTALGVIKLEDLEGEAQDFFAYAVLALGISLALAALALAPQPSRTNPHSAASMRRSLHRIIILRAIFLIPAALAFATALVLAGFVPFVSAADHVKEKSGLSYSLDQSGRLNARLLVENGKPFSRLALATSTRPIRARRTLPQAETFTDDEGDAVLSLKLRRTRGVRHVVLVATWQDEQRVRKQARKVRIRGSTR
jgi:hypothetical protein